MDNSPELELEYPCTWQYKTILEAHHDITGIVKDILDEREHQIKKSQKSKKGTYASYTISVLVHSTDDRKMLFEYFKQHKSIKFVL